MAGNFSFDIVSEVNFQELDNAVNQAQKELSQRYDFKNSKASIEYNKTAKSLTLIADDDFKLKALRDLLEGRMAKRGVSLKSMKSNTPENAFEGALRQTIELISGFPTDKSKELVKIIKEMNVKVQAQIEGEKVKVISTKKDDLQVVMANLRNVEFSLPLQFVNFR